MKYYYALFFILFTALPGRIQAQITGDSLKIDVDSLQVDSALMDQIFKTSRDTIKRFDKWGQVSKADREMTVYASDSTAPAVILHDVGYMQVRSAKKGWFVEHIHVRRIKVFDVSAFDQGNLIIPFRSGRSEKIVNLKVQLILPDSSIQPVKAENMFIEQLSKRYSAMKIFIPNLQRGGIIEYQYTVLSGNVFSLHDWYFHQELPVQWSEISLQFPSLFEYVFLAEAPRPFDVTEKWSPGFGLSFIRFGLSGIPAMKEEPFITTLDDYRAHVRFQLAAIQGFMFMPIEVMTTWPFLANRLMDDKHFGKQYNKSSSIKSLWNDFEPLIAKDESPEAIAEKAQRFFPHRYGMFHPSAYLRK